MNINCRTKTIVAILLTALFATAALPALGHPIVQHSSSASTGGDPIATGNWQQDQYDSLIVQYANQYGLNPFLLKAQIALESQFNTYAVSEVVNVACGYSNDEGLMQINPVCSGEGSADLFDPATNIAIGASIMAGLYQLLGSYDLALQAYNIGASSIQGGASNWAYSSAVDSYAQQFESENIAVGGCGCYSVPGPTPAPTPSQSASAPTSSTSDPYTVQSSDTLYSIAQLYGISWQSIASANGISYPYYISVGQQLTIPGSSYYMVQSGNCLYAIGLNYGVSWQSIASANGISAPYTIYPGQQLVIP
jgi:LysM repeat protein